MLLRIVLLILAVVSPACDGILSVRGRVATPSGVPISGAEILAYDGKATATTDTNGCFDLFKICAPMPHQTFLLIRVRDRIVLVRALDAPSTWIGSVTVKEEGSNMTAAFTPNADIGACRPKP